MLLAGGGGGGGVGFIVYRVQCSGFRVQGFWGLGFRIQCSGFRVQGLGLSYLLVLKGVWGE